MHKNKNKAFCIVYFIIGLISFFPSLSYADCDLGWGNGTRPVGTVVFNTNCDVMQVCQSDNQWHALGPFTPGCGSADTTPDAFSFTDQTGVATSTLISSNTINITGITGSVSVSISGDGSPEFSINGGGWTTSGAITNGQSLQLRLTSNAANSTMNSATVTVGTGSDQWDVTTAGADPCAGSPSPGDVCADGSVYAGLSPDGNVKMYTTAADASSGTFWNNGNSSGYVTTSQTSATTGEANTTNLITIDSDSVVGGTQPHQAAQLCADSPANGHSDWYLPAQDELNVLYTNKAAIGGFNVSGSFPAGYYWSSSEFGSNVAWNQRFSDGSQTFNTKDNGMSVRCVRR
jgi:hypothetical protein